MTDQEIQDQFDRMLVNVQDILGLSGGAFSDTVKPYITRAINYVTIYCNITEIPVQLETVVEDIAIFKYHSKGIENIQSESKGSLSESYRQSLSSDIISQLNLYRQVKVI